VGFRLHKTIRVLPGVHLTVSGSGISYSVGGRKLRITRHPGGRISRTVGLPGLGLSHSGTLREAKPRRAAAPAPAPAAAVWPADPPAPAWERDLLDALQTGRYAEVARTHGRADPTLRLLAAALDGLAEPDPLRARELLGWVAAHDTTALRRHPFTTAHLATRTWPVEIAHGATACLGIANDVVLLAVAELHQAAGDLDVAIRAVEQAEPTAPAALSLTELYSDAGRHADVVDLTNGTVNADDATALLLVFRGRAFAGLGYANAAREALDEALREPARASSVRHRALLERGRVAVSQGDRAAARHDLERILADDPAYPGVVEALDELR
jgi:tetratricopeptide (TPR) repeat protein